MNPFSKVVDPKRMFALQNAQYPELIFMTDTVAANSGGQENNVNVSSKGHFLCLFITGTFETVSTAGAIVDDGVNYLSGQLRDGSRNLFNDRVPLNLFLSPGRRKTNDSTTVLLDPVGNQFLQPLPFQYMFTVNSNITFNVSNVSDVPVQYEIVFHGLRIITNAASEAMRGKMISEGKFIP